MTDATGETDRAGHRLLELGREWSIQGEDIFEVVGTGQVISPGSFEESIYEEIVEVSRGSQIILSWAHMFTATAVVASVWFLLSTRPFPSIWRTIIAALSDFRKSPIKSKVHSSGSCDSRNSTMASSSTGTLRATNRVVANQHRENLTQDALVAYASTPEIRSSSPSATMQIVVVPEQESTGTLCITELSRQITVQAAREVVAAADILDQVLEESGRPRDPSVTLNWAAELHKTSRKLQARQQEEQRRYMYDNWQRETDRAISEQQHQESISAIKEESGCGWAEKLANIRDRCFESVFTAIVRGVVLVAVSRLVPHLFLNPNILSFSTFFNLLKAAFTTLCSCQDNTSGDVPSSIYASFQTYSWSYFFFSEQPGWGFTFCHLLCVVRGFSGVAFVLGYTFCLKLSGCPSCVATAISSTLGALVLSRCAATAIPDLFRLIATQTAMSLLASAYFTTKWWSARRDLRNDGNPSNASINEILLAFDDARAVVRLSPAILVIVAILGELSFV